MTDYLWLLLGWIRRLRKKPVQPIQIIEAVIVGRRKRPDMVFPPEYYDKDEVKHD